ncbi:MAG: non-canonical purine NTP diphosphatase [Bacteroidia bacterium]|nr:non-canonical purine NTP diphosphatase [Bacteroidia bacterium]
MKLVFVTNNQHKLHEIRQLIGEQIELCSLTDIGFTGEIPETHETIEENAREKAIYIYNRYHMDCFADDTGLEIESLDGRPGVYSSRYAGENVSYEDNMNRVLEEMKTMTNRRSRFRTAISLIIGGKEYLFQGEIKGEILTEKRGSSGFGYDPVFKPDGYNKTFAELPLEEKNRISHRGRAIAKLADFLKNQAGGF